ncbi:PREDICTED: paxillin-like [Priapulus caudatus]|uniref:Paxillin-like n=1 Tax=Priapulus caudatus TaxID=37621 RepID=A0ABM1DQQ1_PRICU|nr:PREDICTED: paxillin-like [Priapulus caudatus]
MSTVLSTNLAALDRLLDDLNRAQLQAKSKVSGVYGSPSSSFSSGTPDPRPSVEALLDELESAVPEESTPAPSASSATQELDDLMACLSDFKIKSVSPSKPEAETQEPEEPVPQETTQQETAQGEAAQSETPVENGIKNTGEDRLSLLCRDTENAVHEPQYAQPQRKQRQPPQVACAAAHTAATNPLALDAGNTARQNLENQGVKTTAKGHCAAWRKAIVGQVVTALGRTWHVDHFTCAHCRVPLGNSSFYEKENQPYCEEDYHELFSPKCKNCGKAITDSCVTALGETWHPEHFCCAECGGEFGDDGFHERDGRPYCRHDYFELFAAKCASCSDPITENYISALGTQWHPDCFVCMDCHTPFNGGSFFDHGGMPYCETHYHAKRGSLCAGCGKPITGRCITAMQKKFHPEHFVCAFCLRQLNKGTFKEQNGKPYCHTCHNKVFQV